MATDELDNDQPPSPEELLDHIDVIFDNGKVRTYNYEPTGTPGQLRVYGETDEELSFSFLLTVSDVAAT